MKKQRLDLKLAKLGLVSTRSQAESFIRLGLVQVDGKVITKPGAIVKESSRIKLLASERYVSRAGLKLSSIAADFGLDFKDQLVLDVGSSTGGFTDYALQRGAKKVIAVDVGTDQLHPSLRTNPKIELHEKTDIRRVVVGSQLDRFNTRKSAKSAQSAQFSPVVISDFPNIIVCDVSFISLRLILPHVAEYLMNPETILLAMVKPQFEAGPNQTNKGVVKNNSVRRKILAEFEVWARELFIIKTKRDSGVAGAKGNLERFYWLERSRR